MCGGGVPDSAISRLKKLHGGLLKKNEKKSVAAHSARLGNFQVPDSRLGRGQTAFYMHYHYLFTVDAFLKKRKKSFSSITSAEFHPSSFNIIRRELKREPWKVSRRRCPSPLINRWAWTWPWTEIPMLLFVIFLSSKKLYFHILIQASIS